MSKLSISTILAALCGSALLTACPGDDTTGTGTETESSSSSSTGPVITTVPTTMTMTTDDTTTTMAETTVGVDDTSTTTTGESTTTTGESTTTTGESTTTTGESTTTTGESTTMGESTESSTGEPPPMVGYGDCGNNDDAVACLADEICIGAPLGSAVCMEQGCVDAGDCAVPTSGTAVPACADLAADEMNECYLSCELGETCPDGMTCTLDLACVWDLLPGVCPDQDLGNTVPQMVMDENGGLGNDHDSSCGDGGGADAMYMFTAPAAGSYTFSTEGSAIDTILSILDGCGGMELDCNDDTVMLTSEVTLMMAAGQVVVIVVEGYGGEEGAITLSIS